MSTIAVAVVAGMGGAVVFMTAATLSVLTSAGDQTTWGWRVFRKLRIPELQEAVRKRAARRREATRNQNKNRG